VAKQKAQLARNTVRINRLPKTISLCTDLLRVEILLFVIIRIRNPSNRVKRIVPSFAIVLDKMPFRTRASECRQNRRPNFQVSVGCGSCKVAHRSETSLSINEMDGTLQYIVFPNHPRVLVVASGLLFRTTTENVTSAVVSVAPH